MQLYASLRRPNLRVYMPCTKQNMSARPTLFLLYRHHYRRRCINFGKLTTVLRLH